MVVRRRADLDTLAGARYSITGGRDVARRLGGASTHTGAVPFHLIHLPLEARGCPGSISVRSLALATRSPEGGTSPGGWVAHQRDQASYRFT